MATEDEERLTRLRPRLLRLRLVGGQRESVRESGTATEGKGKVA